MSFFSHGDHPHAVPGEWFSQRWHIQPRDGARGEWPGDDGSSMTRGDGVAEVTSSMAATPAAAGEEGGGAPAESPRRSLLPPWLSSPWPPLVLLPLLLLSLPSPVSLPLVVGGVRGGGGWEWRPVSALA